MNAESLFVLEVKQLTDTVYTREPHFGVAQLTAAALDGEALRRAVEGSGSGSGDAHTWFALRHAAALRAAYVEAHYEAKRKRDESDAAAQQQAQPKYTTKGSTGNEDDAEDDCDDSMHS